MPYSSDFTPVKCMLIYEEGQWYCLNIADENEVMPKKTRYILPLDFDGRLHTLVAMVAESFNRNKLSPDMFSALDTLLVLQKELK